MSKPPKRISDQLRAAIDASGLSRYRICKELGIDQATMSRFMSGERGLTLKVIDRLCEFLGLTLTQRRQVKRRKGR